jgi:hypothetical protein
MFSRADKGTQCLENVTANLTVLLPQSSSQYLVDSDSSSSSSPSQPADLATSHKLLVPARTAAHTLQVQTDLSTTPLLFDYTFTQPSQAQLL